MSYNLKKEQEVNEAMQSGLYDVATLQLFDNITNLDLNSRVVDKLDYAQDILGNHLEEIKTLNDKKLDINIYLNAMKTADISDNQSIEQENSFLIALYMQLSEETAIDKMIRIKKEGLQITSEYLKEIVKTILTGTLSENKKIIRTSNEKFVGKIINGERIIDYFPIDYQYIEIALTKLADLYNNPILNPTYDNVFIQPFLLHGLFGTLQVFGDGNTRMGRLFQHLLLWQLINEKLNYDFDKPPIYATKSYYAHRDEYRKLILNLVHENNNETWNDWFEFNLNRMIEQIHKNNDNLLILKRKLK